MKTTIILRQMSLAIMTMLGVLAFALSASAESLNSLADNPRHDIHGQIHDLLKDFDFALLPHYGARTVSGTISIDRYGRILVKNAQNNHNEIDAQVFRHLDQKLLYNIDEYRGKKVILRIILKRRN